ncbi:ornithine cyclodeaminase [Allgaiera indica]|uniref:Ornithine cyclodeaminase n=1 Tax=Allgaiera indica TaxID=765699 RepID=A0AAN4ZZQ6_9RHOB|nr:ornithine cyclodeaminase [Allgaiera indica]GHE01717.1 ornithine cyclodeaminase [Allgaiera indica]SDW94794.1 ornithine cyclodeaminase [Allgaiera indica]
MKIDYIGPEADSKLKWIPLTDALKAGHTRPKAKLGDVLLERGADKMLSRSAWIDGMGLAVKTATIFPGNRAHGKPALSGSVSLFSDKDGDLEAFIDFKLLTKWKTAGGSLLAARLLARPDSRVILIVGAGAVGRAMLQAYRSVFPSAQYLIWNRTMAAAARLAEEVPGALTTTNLEQAVRGADIIATATMSDAPVILGKWLRPGTHLDLIGAYTPDMREVDDDTLRRARIFVDSRDTTLGHIGELKIPLEAGTIEYSDVIADFYDIEKGLFARTDPDEITLCKNGGGAHLDLMTARHILETMRKK